MAVPVITARPTEAATESHVRWDHALIARLSTGALLKLCALSFAVWMAGNWIADLPTSVMGIDAVGAALGLAGCLAFVVSSYATVRAWQIRHHRW
jgi:hypothetical protein